MTQQSHSWAYTLKKIIILKDACTPVFTAALFTIARTCMHAQWCLSDSLRPKD